MKKHKVTIAAAASHFYEKGDVMNVCGLEYKIVKINYTTGEVIVKRAGAIIRFLRKYWYWLPLAVLFGLGLYAIYLMVMVFVIK